MRGITVSCSQAGTVQGQFWVGCRCLQFSSKSLTDCNLSSSPTFHGCPPLVNQLLHSRAHLTAPCRLPRLSIRGAPFPLRMCNLSLVPRDLRDSPYTTT